MGCRLCKNNNYHSYNKIPKIIIIQPIRIPSPIHTPISPNFTKTNLSDTNVECNKPSKKFTFHQDHIKRYVHSTI
jgi:hypothetical protein